MAEENTSLKNSTKKKETGIIKESGRKALKKMAEISKCVEAIGLMPTPEEFALMLIEDLRVIAKRLNDAITKLNGMMDKYASIPAEFLLRGFDEVLEKLNQLNDFTKKTISDATEVFTSTLDSAKSIANALGSATSTLVSAALQVGGGITYAGASLGVGLKLAMSGEGKRSIEDDVIRDVASGKISEKDLEDGIKRYIETETERRYSEHVEQETGDIQDWADDVRDATVEATTNATTAIDNGIAEAGKGIESVKGWFERIKNSAITDVDEEMQKAIEKVQKAKDKVAEMIENVNTSIKKLTKDFADAFGFINHDPTENAAGMFKNMSENAKKYSEETESPVGNAFAEVADEVAAFIDNFNIGKIVVGLGSLAVSAGAATLAMNLLPSINIDKMLKDIIGGINKDNVNKTAEVQRHISLSDGDGNLFKVIDYPWQLSIDDVERYNADGYEKYLDDFVEENNNKRTQIGIKLSKKGKFKGNLRTGFSDEDVEYNRNLLEKEFNKSALKALRKVRRDAIKARMIEQYKGFIMSELNYLKDEFINTRDKIKNDWDMMMKQYKDAIREIERFFSEEGYGGNAEIDNICDEINKDGKKIKELCKSITVELTNTTANIGIPYSVGPVVDMPVHKLLEFFKDAKYILTFVKDLILLGIDIISQFARLATIIANNLSDLAELFKSLKELLGIDFILDMIDFIIALFKSKMGDAKILLENCISPIYYNETEEFDIKLEAIEALLEDDKDGGNVEKFKYTDDVNARTKYKKVFGGKLKDDDEIEDVLEEFEAKGEREVVAYRSPLLKVSGDDFAFAGWIFYHAYAYDHMKKSWSSRKKRRRNRVIKKAAKKNKIRNGKLIGGVAHLKRNKTFGYYKETTYDIMGREVKRYSYVRNSVTGYDAYYWYTKWTDDPTDCEVDINNKGEDVIKPVQTTSNGSMVELSDGRRVFVKDKVVKSGDFVTVEGKRYRVK